METKEKARFDTRLPKEQKDLLERAAQLGGFKSLSDFVLSAAQQQAEKIFEDYEKILTTKKDQKVFFEALMNPQEPMKKLKKAVADYNQEFNS